MQRASRRTKRPIWIVKLTLLLGLSCGSGVGCGPSQRSSDAAAPHGALPNPQKPLEGGGGTGQEQSDAGVIVSQADASAPSACPEGMAHVRHDFCPELERRCLKSEYDPSNRLTICHRFDPASNDCRAARVPLDYCIDRYEFPNERGAKPPVMVSFYDAERACGELGKRLCYEREWVAACEGPEEKPFPYGYDRSKEHCNIDNPWISPSLSRVYSKDRAVQEAELARLDQSRPSGAMEGCVSDFGVYDLTGNFDEWTRADQERPRARGRFAALKGGAWGHVRNACRPVTTSHGPDFTYYFVSFRCCADARGAGAPTEQ